MTERLLIKPREHDLGDFSVRRLLPYVQKRTVGPFIFFDHMGPATFKPGSAINVRPHPHIGLATLTYLFEGQLLHRDSLGTAQTIDPGDVNWMVAGRGIAHSERVADHIRENGQKLHGLQIWIALPTASEETAPEFHHYEAASLPRFALPGAAVTLIAGTAFGQTSPVKIFSPLIYLDIKLAAGAQFELPAGIAEHAVYLLSGEIETSEGPIGTHEMAVWADGKALNVTARRDSHLVAFGGDPFPEARHIFWNFVSSSKERLEQAKAEWRDGRFAKVPGDDIEFIPLPE
jgi:redox-sensitive bicupin YhaK (pirin superfamily)